MGVLVVALSIVAVHAGVLNAQSGETTAEGTLLTVTWSQGCFSQGLGPNACSSTQPLFCPLSSTGFTPLQPNCGGCGCAFGSGTYCDDADPRFCQACNLDCDDVCGSGWSSCSFDYAAQCTVVNVECEYGPEFIGYARPRSSSASCGDRRGKELYGVPNGDGTYRDCELIGQICGSGGALGPIPVPGGAGIGTTLGLCPEGYLRDGSGSPQTAEWNIYSTYGCFEAEGCGSSPDPDPDPGPGPGGCTGDSQCPDTVTRSCEGSVLREERAYSHCNTETGACYEGLPYANTARDCRNTACPPDYIFGASCVGSSPNAYCSCGGGEAV